MISIKNEISKECFPYVCQWRLDCKRKWQASVPMQLLQLFRLYSPLSVDDGRTTVPWPDNIVLRLSNRFSVLTWAHHVPVTILCHVTRSGAWLTTMGHLRIGTGTRALLSPSATCHTTVAPGSPHRPVSVN